MLPFIAAIIVVLAAPDTVPLPASAQRDTAAHAHDGTAVDVPDPFTLLGVAPVGSLSPRAAFAPDSDRSATPAVEHSDLYYTRLTIHRWTSYATVPLLAAQYVVGQRLGDGGDDGDDAEGEGDDDGGGSLGGMHQTLAGALAGAFAINTITGGWNLVESWKEPGKVRKAHSILMLLADAAFVGTFATAPEDDGDSDTHRALAITGGGLAVTGFALMVPTLLGRD